MAGTRPEDAGAASGVVNVSHQLGASTGLGVMSAVATAAEAGHVDAIAIAHGASAALQGATGLMLLALLVAVLLILPVRGVAVAARS
ncbi:hypothetical protein [Pseudoxanthomonas sp.]|uniref:hypothetical protein n=1 Tax=Pseudoxanthomonas sp. TaxID=1871049 RepID=UPI00262EFC20|nr:hypothetical protein [Pseudoxanthomonas sp.]WDS36592.1 MAG: hypothetical protein O8I58_01320 [Pseudoxanthomonas sp.]